MGLFRMFSCIYEISNQISLDYVDVKSESWCVPCYSHHTRARNYAYIFNQWKYLSNSFFGIFDVRLKQSL